MSGNLCKMVLSVVLVISLHREKLFNVGVRLLKTNRKSYPFMAKMGKSVRHGAMATIRVTSQDDEN